ncbi:MAG: hypothetical protein ACYTGB_08380 [Planctomycetota bacterium]
MERIAGGRLQVELPTIESAQADLFVGVPFLLLVAGGLTFLVVRWLTGEPSIGVKVWSLFLGWVALTATVKAGELLVRSLPRQSLILGPESIEVRTHLPLLPAFKRCVRLTDIVGFVIQSQRRFVNPRRRPWHYLRLCTVRGGVRIGRRLPRRTLEWLAARLSSTVDVILGHEECDLLDVFDDDLLLARLATAGSSSSAARSMEGARLPAPPADSRLEVLVDDERRLWVRCGGGRYSGQIGSGVATIVMGQMMAGAILYISDRNEIFTWVGAAAMSAFGLMGGAVTVLLGLRVRHTREELRILGEEIAVTSRGLLGSSTRVLSGPGIEVRNRT